LASKILEKAKETLSTAKDSLTDFKDILLDEDKKEIAAQFKDSSQTKVKDFLSTLNEYGGLFKDAGYEISGINASISIPPDISISFNCLTEIPADEREKILAKAEKNNLALIIVKSLFKASDFSDAVKIGEFRLRHITLKLGIIPGITISFL
jgi:hypothetical protein